MGAELGSYSLTNVTKNHHNKFNKDIRLAQTNIYNTLRGQQPQRINKSIVLYVPTEHVTSEKPQEDIQNVI